MSITAGRVFFGLKQVSLSRGLLVHQSTVSRLTSVRCLALSTQRPARSERSTEDEDMDKPIRFSTSKAGQRTWKVEHSMGSQFQLPWWKVLPISLFCISFLLWCVLREETDIDTKLEKHLYEHLPGLLSEKDKQVKSNGES